MSNDAVKKAQRRAEHAAADDAAARNAAETGAPSRDEMTIAFTPKQLFTGFAILAGLFVLARRRARRSGREAEGGDRRSSPDDDKG